MPEIKFELPKIEHSPEKVDTGSGLEQQENSSSEAIQQNTASGQLDYLPKQIDARGVPTIPLRRKLEDVLSAGLENIYLDMDAGLQARFRQKGEETSTKIADMLKKGKASIGKVLKLIVGWLRIIPGINKHFLEQEAKIKADEIMKMQIK